jgi:tellurite resistance protein
MTFTDKVKSASEISGTKPWENLSLQDALTIIAMYAAQLDPAAKDDEKVRRIAALAKKHPLFSEKSAAIVARIHRLAESVDIADFPQAVDQAVKSLTLKLRQTAFEWAAGLAVDNGILSNEKQELVEQLRTKLYIDTNTANKIINDAVTNSLH